MIHEFSSTRDAYDASRCYVDTGDVLYVPQENVVGVSYTWPFAITEGRGALHGLAPIDSLSPGGEDLKQMAMDAAWEVVRASLHN